MQFLRHRYLNGWLACWLPLGLALIGNTALAQVDRAPRTIAVAESATSVELSFDKDLRGFLSKYCFACHGPKVTKADLALHKLTDSDLEQWEAVAENLELELMPPPKHPQPSAKKRAAILKAIRTHLKNNDIEFKPEPTSSFGNRVNHKALFSGEHKGPAFSYSRIWRIRQRIYDDLSSKMQATRGVAGSTQGPIPSLMEIEGNAFKDYAIGQVDDAAMRSMMLNYRELASAIVRGRFRKGRYNPKTGRVDPGTYDFNRAPLRKLKLLNVASPGPETYDPAIQASFELLLSRVPTADEYARYRKFLAKSIQLSDPVAGCQNMVMAILMSPEFVFRMELGGGKRLKDGRRILSPQEISYAIAYTLTDSPPDLALKKAVADGRLKTPADVAREVKRMLSARESRRNWRYHMTGGASFEDWKPEHNPRLLRFFQEFFGYTKAHLVFKDESRNPHHFPRNLIRDADFMILDILEKDQSVLETLLTTDHFVVAYTPHVEHSLQRLRDWAQERPEQYGGGAIREGIQPVLVDKGYRKETVQAYGYRYWEWDYPLKQPFSVNHRVGFLTHPAWLVAWSGNFDNDIIRRGKWIREHLLADSVPELPIGVDAKLPNDPHQSLRSRMKVTRAEECWRCHKQMDPLGMAFEDFDDFGRYRNKTIPLGDDTKIAKARKRHSEQRNQLLKKIWKLTADAPAERKKQIQFLRERIDNLKPPARDHPRYSSILKEQAQRRTQWNSRIQQLSQSGDETKRKTELAKLRQQLAEMKPPTPTHRARVQSHGTLIGTRDANLDGPYENVQELMHRLAQSTRVRQSFIRHVFRFFMGRNEMLSDSPTLMAMDRAYVSSGGSFRQVLVTLMSSDSFLTRRIKE